MCCTHFQGSRLKTTRVFLRSSLGSCFQNPSCFWHLPLTVCTYVVVQPDKYVMHSLSACDMFLCVGQHMCVGETACVSVALIPIILFYRKRNCLTLAAHVLHTFPSFSPSKNEGLFLSFPGSCSQNAICFLHLPPTICTYVAVQPDNCLLHSPTACDMFLCVG